MRIFKKNIFVLLLLGVAVYLWQLNFTQAKDLPEDNLQFCVDGGRIYFFQPQTGRIFVYPSTTGRFSRVYTLEKLGKDLRQSRSISVLEEEEAQD